MRNYYNSASATRENCPLEDVALDSLRGWRQGMKVSLELLPGERRDLLEEAAAQYDYLTESLHLSTTVASFVGGPGVDAWQCLS